MQKQKQSRQQQFKDYTVLVLPQAIPAPNNLTTDLEVVLQEELRPMAGGGWRLQADHQHTDPRLAGTRQLMMKIPEMPYLTTSQPEKSYALYILIPKPTRVLAWRIPGTEEPGRLPSMGSHTTAAT